MSSLPQVPVPDMLRFDVYEVDSRAGELRKHGYRVPLEDRPFRALEILLLHAPEVVTRDELRKQLWAPDVFIDFDQGLNKAIGKVRRALNDNADEPRFIETVGRCGYRFIAPLARTPLNPIPVVVERQPAVITLEAPRQEISETRLRSRRTFTLMGIAAVAVLLMAFLFRPQSPKLQVASIVQITKSGEAWPLEPMATDGPRLYYQSLSRNGSATESPPDWRGKAGIAERE